MDDCSKITKIRFVDPTNMNIDIRPPILDPIMNNSEGIVLKPPFCSLLSQYPSNLLISSISFDVCFYYYNDVSEEEELLCCKYVEESCTLNLEHGYKSADLNYGSNNFNNREILVVNPNPFSSDPIIEYMVNSDSKASLEVFNSIGELVKVIVSGPVKPGSYSVKFDTDGLSDGIYYIKLTNGDRIIIKLVIKIK